MAEHDAAWEETAGVSEAHWYVLATLLISHDPSRVAQSGRNQARLSIETCLTQMRKVFWSNKVTLMYCTYLMLTKLLAP